MAQIVAGSVGDDFLCRTEICYAAYLPTHYNLGLMAASRVEYKFVEEKDLTRLQEAVNALAKQGWRIVQFYSAPIFGSSPPPFIVVMELSSGSRSHLKKSSPVL